MSEVPTGSHGARRYEIRLKGHLDSRWTSWFDGLDLIAQTDGTTVMEGVLIDQAALHGLLRKLRDAGLPLISVNQIPAGDPSRASVSSTTTGQRSRSDHVFGHRQSSR